MSLLSTFEKLKITGAGDHMVMLYDDDDYSSDIIAAYIGSRLVKNEKCFYIAGDGDVELMLSKLSELVSVESYINSGQFSILSKSDAYSKEGRFDPDTMIEMLKVLATDAIEEGYNAFAITGEISWVLEYESGFDKIMEYEYKLNKQIFGNYPVSAICRYNIKKFSSEMIKSIIEVHPLIIWKSEIHENPFYIEIVDTNGLDINEYQVFSMLQIICDFTNTKSKFYMELKKREEDYHKLEISLMQSMIVSLTSLLEIHDKYTKNHSENVAKIAKQIAETMHLPLEEVTKIYFAGLVHDIGKTVIPSEIINKTEKLTQAEFDVIKKHSSYGYTALARTEELTEIAEYVRQHHERYDGTGYPIGTKGDEIPLAARILSVADAYDAMINERPYHKAKCQEAALDELKKWSGLQFDPSVVDALFKSL
jgi:putative nucleotidyltransferase with HDIG domain